MRARGFLFWLFGLLSLYAAARVIEVNRERGLIEASAALPDQTVTNVTHGDALVQARSMINENKPSLEKRRRRGGRSRTKQKAIPKKQQPNNSKKAGDNKKANTRKKPVKKQGPCPKGKTRGKGGKCVKQSKAGKKTKNLEIAEKAAKPKVLKQGAKFRYLFHWKSARGANAQQALVMGKVAPQTKPADGSMDFMAVSSETIMPVQIPSSVMQLIKEKCLTQKNQKCKGRDTLAYKCVPTTKRFDKNKYKFEGHAAPVVVNPYTYSVIGDQLISKNPTYDVVFHNCNVQKNNLLKPTKLTTGQDKMLAYKLELLQDVFAGREPDADPDPDANQDDGLGTGPQDGTPGVDSPADSTTPQDNTPGADGPADTGGSSGLSGLGGSSGLSGLGGSSGSSGSSGSGGSGGDATPEDTSADDGGQDEPAAPKKSKTSKKNKSKDDPEDDVADDSGEDEEATPKKGKKNKSQDDLEDVSSGDSEDESATTKKGKNDRKGAQDELADDGEDELAAPKEKAPKNGAQDEDDSLTEADGASDADEPAVQKKKKGKNDLAEDDATVE